VLVAAGILVLRYREPGRARPFRTPLVPFVPVLCILICGYLMFKSPTKTWMLFLIWLAVGLVLYFLYGRRHSRLNPPTGQPIPNA